MNKIKLDYSDIVEIVTESIMKMLMSSGDEEVKAIIREKAKDITNIISLFEETNPRAFFKEIKYFSPDGNEMPNGIAFQRGNFLKECKDNLNVFVLDEDIHGNQYGVVDYRGCVIVFSTDVNAVELDNNKILNKVKQIIATLGQRLNTSKISHKIITDFNRENDEYIGAYSIGHAFKGHYVGDNGEQYNEHSTTLEIGGLSSQGLLRIAEMLCRTFRQETVLVKDFNNMKFYLANGNRSGEKPDFDSVNTKV